MPDNQAIWVLEEEVAYSNIQPDNNRHNAFNLYLSVYYGGVVTFKFFTEAYNANYYSQVLLPQLGAALQKIENETDFKATVIHHDNCLNGKKDESSLNQHLGAGRWTTYMGAPCKDVVSFTMFCFFSCKLTTVNWVLVFVHWKDFSKIISCVA